MGTFLSIVHECGHGLYVLLFGGKIYEINIFPISLFTEDSYWSGGYIIWGTGDGFTDMENFVVSAGGSMSTFIVGIILLYILVRYELRPVVELWGWLYSVFLLFDLIFYILVDLTKVSFFLFTDVAGDWEKIFEMWSFGKYVFGFMSIFLFMSITYVIFSKKSIKYFNY